ncbi:MAG: class II fumarate hydratase [Promethearchaeota archaeon]|nr:MAG: class II fumarate hydratase [Candidatus Lokiarchaeota archaeon]
MDFRIEKDVLGELEVPKQVYWGINTQRALQNFKISGKTMPYTFIKALAVLKKACLLANTELGLIETDISKAILQAIDELLNEDKYRDQFPIDIYQTGSGTQTNMNMNEVLANRANQILGYPMGLKKPVHPNDHINRCQSSNDVIPTAMHISTLHLIDQKMLPSLEHLLDVLNQKVREFNNIVKVGRTHLQDAVPIPLSMEFNVYKQQIELSIKRIKEASKELYNLPIGGTAVGTGLNVTSGFVVKTISHLSNLTNIPFKSNPIKAESISSHNRIVKVSSVVNLLAISLLKIANDIRWMGSGPRAGLSELILPQNEPGSSIMPGKINPTQSEALIQVCLQVMGNHTTITAGEFYGSVLDLNVCKPLMISNLLDSLEILSNAVNSFIENCLKGIVINENKINSQLEGLLMVVTNLTPILGYDKCSEIALKAYHSGKSIKETINEMGLELDQDLDKLLDVRFMAYPNKSK